MDHYDVQILSPWKADSSMFGFWSENDQKRSLENDLPFCVLLISVWSGTELPFGIRKVIFYWVDLFVVHKFKVIWSFYASESDYILFMCIIILMMNMIIRGQWPKGSKSEKRRRRNMEKWGIFMYPLSYPLMGFEIFMSFCCTKTSSLKADSFLFHFSCEDHDERWFTLQLLVNF